MEQFSFPYQKGLTSQLPQDAQELIAAAQKATDGAYAPYSKFKVGSALRLSDGSIVTGANHENASFSVGICAERAALATLDMNSGAPKVKAIAVTYQGGNSEAPAMPLSPCGVCRQSILEVQQWQREPIKIYLCSPDGQVIVVEDAASLLPFSFGSAFLEPGLGG